MPLLLAQAGGSLEHPYHFWTAYFIPICDWLVNNPDCQEVFVIECGPMTAWLDYLRTKREVTIIKPRTALNNYLKGQDSVVFLELDDPARFDLSNPLKNIDAILSTFFGCSQYVEITETKKGRSKKSLREVGRLRVGVLERKKGLPFYSTQASEAPLSGSERRSIPNIHSLAKRLDKYSELQVEVVDTTLYAPNQAVELYRSTEVLVGQFGAGLTNMVWMAPGSWVIELRGPGRLFGQDWDDCYKNLALQLGHNFISLKAQDDWHGRVRVGDLAQKIYSILTHHKMTDRKPV